MAIRRAALKDGNRTVGFPTITFPCEMASNLDMETMIAAMFMSPNTAASWCCPTSAGESVCSAAAGAPEHLYRSRSGP
jgi:hypothetical protein